MIVLPVGAADCLSRLSTAQDDGDMFFGTIKNGRGRAPTLQNTHKFFENLFDFVGNRLLPL